MFNLVELAALAVGDEAEDMRGFLRGRGHCSTVEIAIGGLGSQHAHAGILDDLSSNVVECSVYGIRFQGRVRLLDLGDLSLRVCLLQGSL